MMKRQAIRWWVISIALGLHLVSFAQACFEIEPLTPQERGAATHLALGLVRHSFDVHYCEEGESSGFGAIGIYGFKPFGVHDIEFGAIWASFPFVKAEDSILLSYQRLKALSYFEQIYLFSYRIRLGTLWIQPVARFGTIRADGSLVDWALLLDFRLGGRIRRDTRFSVGLKNPFGLGLRNQGDNCAQEVTTGFGLLISKTMAWGIELLKEGGFPTSVATGVEWYPSSRLALRTGLRTYPSEFCFGLGIRVRNVAIDLASSVNLDLGVTYEVGATCLWY